VLRPLGIPEFKRVLLIGMSTRALAESATRKPRDYHIVSLDYFGDFDQRQIVENYSLLGNYTQSFSIERLFERSLDLAFDAVVYTSNLENHPDLVERLAERAIIIGNSPETLKKVRDPGALAALCERCGFRFPRTILLQDSPLPKINGRFLLKPLKSGGGHGIVKCISTSKLREKGKSFFLQEYLEGLSLSAAFLANGSKSRIIGISEQLSGIPEFRTNGFQYCGNIVLLDSERYDFPFSHMWEKCQVIAEALTTEFVLKGLNCIDFISKNGKPYLIEINPRYSASMELYERGWGLDLFELHVKSIFGEFPVLTPSRKIPARYFGKAILYARDSITIPGISPFIDSEARDIPHQGDFIKRGAPVCTLYSLGMTRDECYNNLIKKSASLEKKLYCD
jgi:predicted ATP-grasp superfamily ATP-dependent carboligase